MNILYLVAFLFVMLFIINLILIKKSRPSWHFPSKGDFPKENKRLLLYNNEIFTGTYHYCPIDGRPDIEPHNWWSDDGLYLPSVKAWQYLPEPPKALA